MIKAELLEKTPCDQIDGILIFENPNAPAIGINQTIYKCMKIFGTDVKDSIIVIISQAASVAEIPEAIEQRIIEC